MSGEGALRAEAVGVAFDGLKALSDVTLAIPRGRVTGLIGPNGAGKTTAVNVLSGFQKPTTGRVVMDGADVTGRRPHELRRLGLARTFQGGRLFGDLSVIDNLEVTGVGLGHTRREAARRAAEMLDWIGIGRLAGRMAAGLPYTDERRVAIGRALMMEPAYLLLDEPAAGMSEPEAAELARLIRRVAAEIGCGILLIEHNIGLVLDICEAITVLDSGRVIEAGDPAAIRASERVRHAYMGTAADVAPASVEAGH
ncbi:ABC transporter ATP-binding protein [Amaricoccus sp.]|uniref:ABC transporter ATP-binding protein n=1 Tax=Amaricoccus sp. TaxID=1872485 RepID=UPI001B6BC14C|nr:ABC transporter ATP-binding protein [Amaricoccus sp.]MBP7000980.1 ABC transporter ATP-binding protein [Amaricoccus sp.]